MMMMQVSTRRSTEHFFLFAVNFIARTCHLTDRVIEVIRMNISGHTAVYVMLLLLVIFDIDSGELIIVGGQAARELERAATL